MASQITNLTIVCSTVYSYAAQRKHQSSASLAFVWGIHRGPVNSLHKWPVARKMYPFDDVIVVTLYAKAWRTMIIIHSRTVTDWPLFVNLCSPVLLVMIVARIRNIHIQRNQYIELLNKEDNTHRLDIHMGMQIHTQHEIRSLWNRIFL